MMKEGSSAAAAAFNASRQTWEYVFIICGGSLRQLNVRHKNLTTSWRVRWKRWLCAPMEYILADQRHSLVPCNSFSLCDFPIVVYKTVKPMPLFSEQ